MAKQFIVMSGADYEGYEEPEASFDKLEDAVAFVDKEKKTRSFTNFWTVFNTDNLEREYEHRQ